MKKCIFVSGKAIRRHLYGVSRVTLIYPGHSFLKKVSAYAEGLLNGGKGSTGLVYRYLTLQFNPSMLFALSVSTCFYDITTFG